jgi:hypothetical protein
LRREADVTRGGRAVSLWFGGDVVVNAPGAPGVTLAHILRSLQALHLKADILMTQQDEIDADVTELNTATSAILAEIAALQAANPSLDLTALKAAADAVAAIAPPAP